MKMFATAFAGTSMILSIFSPLESAVKTLTISLIMVLIGILWELGKKN